mgnify:CR=1 FL=1
MDPMIGGMLSGIAMSAIRDELGRSGKNGRVGERRDTAVASLLFINKEDIKQNENHCERRMGEDPRRQ